MINIAFTVLSLVVLSVAVFTRDHSFSSLTPEQTPNVLASETESTQTPEPTQEPTATPSPTPTVIPSQTPAPTQAPSQTITVGFNLSSWQYPNTAIVSKDGSSMTLTSNDDPKIIVNWYKEKIKAEDFHATSMALTNVVTNGALVAEDKIKASSGDREVSIEISKKADEGFSTIKVSLKGDQSSV